MRRILAALSASVVLTIPLTLLAVAYVDVNNFAITDFMAVAGSFATSDISV